MLHLDFIMDFSHGLMFFLQIKLNDGKPTWSLSTILVYPLTIYLRVK
jgi:hypothetical protein